MNKLYVSVLLLMVFLSACTYQEVTPENSNSVPPVSGLVVSEKPLPHVEEWPQTMPEIAEANETINPNEVEPVGPKMVETPKSDITQKAEKELVKRTDKGITLALYNVSYEIRGEDYAIVNGLRFGIENGATESISAKVLVYFWDENDISEHKNSVRAEIAPDTFFGTLSKGESVNQTSLVKIPLNDINLNKTMKIILIEDAYYHPQTYVSVEYTFNISDLSKQQ